MLPAHSNLIEQAFSKGLFVLIRNLNDYTCGLLPFPTIYLVLLVYIIVLVSPFFRNIPIKKAWRKTLFNFLGLIGFSVFFFYWSWAFNYNRLSIEEKFNLPLGQIDSSYINQEFNAVYEELIVLRNEIQDDTFALSESHFKEIEDSDIRHVMKTFFKNNGLLFPGRTRVRKLYPKGLLLILNTAGIYLPFSGEGHIDPGMHLMQHPFTMAHEMCHALGYGDEATCNFLAFLATRRAEDKAIRYSAILAYWRYLARSQRTLDRDYYRTFYKNMHPGLRNDLIAIHVKLNKYPSLMPKFRNLIYDHYLKSQGVKEGMLSYSRIIPLMKAWKEKVASEDAHKGN